MQKDLKIGMAVGLILVAVAIAILSTHKKLSIKSEILQSGNTEQYDQPVQNGNKTPNP